MRLKMEKSNKKTWLNQIASTTDSIAESRSALSKTTTGLLPRFTVD